MARQDEEARVGRLRSTPFSWARWPLNLVSVGPGLVQVGTRSFLQHLGYLDKHRTPGRSNWDRKGSTLPAHTFPANVFLM